jgi:hypothetical protein
MALEAERELLAAEFQFLRRADAPARSVTTPQRRGALEYAGEKYVVYRIR